MAGTDLTPTPRNPLRLVAELAPIVAHLEARYPGIEVVWVDFRTLDDGTRQQNVTFRAPIARLIEAGLLTPAMVEASRDGRRSPQSTPAGCGYHLALQAEGEPATLVIFTGEAPRERERFGVKDAARVLARFRRPAG